MQQHVVCYVAAWHKCRLGAVDDAAQNRSKPEYQHLGNYLQVAVEQRDGPVAGWICPLLTSPLVDKGDEAQALTLRQPQLGLAEAVVERLYQRRPHDGPHGCVELVGEAIAARGLPPRQATERFPGLAR